MKLTNKQAQAAVVLLNIAKIVLTVCMFFWFGFLAGIASLFLATTFRIK